MKTAVRVLVSVVAFLAVDCFVFWMSAGLLPGVNAPFWASHLLGLACAAGAGWFVWTRWVGMAGSGVGRVLSCGLFGAIVVGAVGFSIGFFGPIIFTPSSNQGPLLGLFITGPAGFLLGGLGGLLYGMVARAE
jgi:hypothetical protein